MTPDARTGPLAGVRILDLTTVVMGPFATQILAGLGADVIKVESPEGDNMRHVGPMRNAGMGHIFLQAGRGKRSLVLDLKQSAAREALLRLAATADVLITNVRAKAMARLGLDYESVRAASPRIVYVTCRGFGSRGPYADQPAYDDLIQGAAGIASLMALHATGEPRYPPITLADRVTGLHAVYAVTAALFARERTGAGQAVEVPMFEAVSQFVLADHLGGHSFEPSLGRPGYDRLLSPHRRPYATADGYLCVLIYNDQQWKRFFAAIGEPDRPQRDPRFASHTARARHIGEVYAWVAEVMRTRTTAEWRALLGAADIPNTPVNSLDDLVADPHLAAVGMIAPEAHPTEGALRATGTPTVWSGTPTGAPTPAPRLGEHSREVLAEAGYGDTEIDALIRDRATIVAD